MNPVDFTSELNSKVAMTDAAIRQILDDQTEIPARLSEAMAYMLFSPGKKIRSAIVLWCCELIQGKVNDAALAAAAAIEMVHTYSLIHDDLPAMDDDDMRRGQPSCHKQFDQAVAILAGDALLTLAFEVLSAQVNNAETAIRMVRTLSAAAGPAGMIAGQMDDMLAEKTAGTMELLQRIHINKTSRMFAAAAGLGAIAGQASSQQLGACLEYGLKLGLCFQIADDILDVTADTVQLGKTAGKDKQQGKLTYPSLVGLEESKKIAEQLTRQAGDALAGFNSRADLLRQLAQRMLTRKN